jgi:hypothetical protein
MTAILLNNRDHNNRQRRKEIPARACVCVQQDVCRRDTRKGATVYRDHGDDDDRAIPDPRVSRSTIHANVCESGFEMSPCLPHVSVSLFLVSLRNGFSRRRAPRTA